MVARVPTGRSIAHNRAVSGDSDDVRRQQRRREIIGHAKLQFAEHGFHNASVSDIINAANIARGTFYLYFQSKQAVFDSILDEALVQLRARITRIEVGDDAAPPQTQLRQNLVRVLDFVLEDRPLTMILLNHRQSPRPEVAQRIDAFFGDIAKLIQASLTYGITMKLVRPCDTAIVASALMGAVRGVIEHCIQQPEPPTSESLVEELLAFVRQGVFVG